jgi:hypothetical protein
MVEREFDAVLDPLSTPHAGQAITQVDRQTQILPHEIHALVCDLAASCAGAGVVFGGGAGHRHFFAQGVCLNYW